MGCSPREAQRRISSTEFAESIALENLDPDPMEAMAAMLAILTSRVLNYTSGKGARTIHPGDLWPALKPTPKTPQQLFNIFRVASSAAQKVKPKT